MSTLRESTASHGEGPAKVVQDLPLRARSCLCRDAGRTTRLCSINGFSADRCSACGLIFLAPQPTPEELRNYYEGYHTGESSRSVGDDQWFLSHEGERDLFNRILLLAKRFGSGTRLLDIGCSYGHLVSAALDVGFDAHGIEPLPEPYRFAVTKLGSRVRQGSLENHDSVQGTFAVVVMANVLEHLPSPIDALHEVHRILEPGGSLIVVVPNVWPFLPLVTLALRLGRRNSLVSRLAVFDTPFHLYFFTPATLRRLCRETGFTVVKAENAPVIMNRSRLKTIVKRVVKVSADVVTAATKSRVLPGHSIILVATKDAGAGNAS